MSIDKIWSAVRQSLQPRGSSADVPELAEIRHDILEEIRGNVQELSAGRYVFPYDRIAIALRPRTPTERAAIQTVWIDGGELEAGIRAVLARADCQYDKNLTVEIQLRDTSIEPPADTAGEPEPGRNFWLTLERKTVAEPAAQPHAALCLSVLTGAADPPSLVLSAPITNLGRLREIFDGEGQFVRCNDLAFTELENGVNETVGRTHAHIVRQANGRFALANSRRNDKTPVAIIRHGRSIPVILIAEPIEPGDVILLGRARIAVS